MLKTASAIDPEGREDERLDGGHRSRINSWVLRVVTTLGLRIECLFEGKESMANFKWQQPHWAWAGIAQSTPVAGSSTNDGAVQVSRQR